LEVEELFITLVFNLTEELWDTQGSTYRALWGLPRMPIHIAMALLARPEFKCYFSRVNYSECYLKEKFIYSHHIIQLTRVYLFGKFDQIDASYSHTIGSPLIITDL